ESCGTANRLSANAWTSPPVRIKDNLLESHRVPGAINFCVFNLRSEIVTGALTRRAGSAASVNEIFALKQGESVFGTQTGSSSTASNDRGKKGEAPPKRSILSRTKSWPRRKGS